MKSLLPLVFVVFALVFFGSSSRGQCPGYTGGNYGNPPGPALPPGTAASGFGTAGGFSPAGVGTAGATSPAGVGTGGSSEPSGTGGTTSGGSSRGGAATRPGGPAGSPGMGGTGASPFGGTTLAGKKRSENSSETWATWWFFNSDRFLNLKATVRRQRRDTDTGDLFMGQGASDQIVAIPAKKVRDLVNPALEAATRDANFSVRASAAIALGKTGYVENFGPIFSALHDSDYRVRESACLGLGILGDPAAVPHLIEIMNDSETGRRTVGLGNEDIEVRTRAFAALALGLIGTRTDISNTQVVPALLSALKSRGSIPHRDLAVAPAVALGLIGSKASIPELIAFARDENQDSWTRAHVIGALAKMEALEAKELLLDGLRDKQNAVVQSSAIGLGKLLGPDDQPALTRLRRMIGGGGDRSARNFAIISLGQIGGIDNRNFLLRLVRTGNSFETTFSAMALAVYYSEMQNSADLDRSEVGQEIHRAFARTKNPIERGAFAIALGCLDHDEAGNDILAVLKSSGSANLRSDLSIALGLMRFAAAEETIRDA
ncbi:MAG: HEAT repeat domain-containing protein, partial [Planctomycetes bacterium]|nr:HEAT repeat domain-containing protein [Planctomycetota bacterium]